ALADVAGARFLYALANFQNPSGRSIDAPRRVALARAAEAAGVPIVEDNPYGELWYDTPPPPPIASHWSEGTVYLGSFSKAHAPTIRARYRAQRDAMAAELAAHLPTSGPLACRWQTPAGGMFFWVELPEGVDSEVLLAKAIERGVAFVPGAPFFAGAPRRNAMRLSFVTLEPAAIERGVQAIAAALAELHDE